MLYEVPSMVNVMSFLLVFVINETALASFLPVLKRTFAFGTSSSNQLSELNAYDNLYFITIFTTLKPASPDF